MAGVVDAALIDQTARSLHAFAFGYDPSKRVIAQGTLWDGIMDDERAPFIAQAENVLAVVAPVLVARGRAEERERIRAALKDGTPADRAAEVLDYWAERNGAFMVSSVKANNRRSAREAWITAVDRAALAVVDAGVDS